MALNKVKKEDLANEMERRKYFECIELERTKIDKRNKFRNLTRYMHIQRSELEEDERVKQEKQKAAIKDAEFKREEKLAEELDKMKREEVKELRLRQVLRETCPELRELKSKLRAAYVNKQLMTQLAEKEAERMENKLKEKRAYKLLEEARISTVEANKRQAELEMIEKAKYKQELQDQIILQEKTRRYMYEEFLREKKMIDDIVQRIHDEDERMHQEKMCKMQKTKQEMIAFEEAQAIWRKKERTILEEENRRLQEYIQQKSREEHAKKMHHHQEELRKSQIFEGIAKKMYAKQTLIRQRDYLIQELKEEEYKAAIEERYRADLEKAMRARIEIRDSLNLQLAEKEETLRKAAAEDAAYKAQFIAKVAEDQRLDQLTAQKRREKMMQLRKDAEEMMTERRQKRAEEMQELIRLHEEDKKETERRKRIIEEERIKMLNEHAKHLLGYLPRGVLREDDLSHLGCEVYQQYKKSDSGSPHTSNALHFS